MLNVNNQINKIPMLWNLFFGSLDVSFCLIGLALRCIYLFLQYCQTLKLQLLSSLGWGKNTLFYHGPQLARCRFFFCIYDIYLEWFISAWCEFCDWNNFILINVNNLITTLPQHSYNLHARYIPEPRNTSNFSIMIYIKITYKKSQGHTFCFKSLFTIFGI